MFLGINIEGFGRVRRMVSGASVQFPGTRQRAHLIIYRLDPFMDSPHMAGVIGDPVEPSPSYRPCPRALLGRPLAFPFSQSKAAMSCQRGQVRCRASMAAANSNSAAMSSFVKRTYKDKKNLNNGALFLVYLS